MNADSVTEVYPIPVSDRELMERLAAGELRALGDLYLRHGGMVRSAIVRVAPEISRAELDELTQEVFLTVSGKAKTYQEVDRLKSWLYGIASRSARSWRRNTWLRRHLLERRKGEPVAMALPTCVSPEETVMLRETVMHLLKKLPVAQREVLLLHAVEGWSGEEIAHALSITHETVRLRLFRARRTLLESGDAAKLADWKE